MTAPTTQWIRDSGTVVETSTDVLVDELGNFFVDELGNNLLDSVSTDGGALAHAWEDLSGVTTTWAKVFGSNLPNGRATRTTAQGDTRVTAQGDTRVTSDSLSNTVTPTAWTEDEY